MHSDDVSDPPSSPELGSGAPRPDPDLPPPAEPSTPPPDVDPDDELARQTAATVRSVSRLEEAN